MAVRILSIDGGGIRGIIPALMLAELERLTGRPTCRLFDLIAGTSTGGIIALALTVPGQAGPDGEPLPRWSASDLADLYVSEGPNIFHRSLMRTVETVDGLVGEKYAPTGLENALQQYMGETLLPQALTDVLVTSYDIQKHEPFFFKSFQPQPRTATDPRDSAARLAPTSQPPMDYPMRAVARATSAAPTYFEPQHLPAPALPVGVSGGDPARDLVLVDGGTFANNPAMCAYAEAKRNHPAEDVLIVSLGTGRLTESISFGQAQHWGLVEWARPLLGIIMDGSSTAIDYQLDELIGSDEGHFRFQTELVGVNDSLDDASASNIAGLRKLAEASIQTNASRLAQVAGRLA